MSRKLKLCIINTPCSANTLTFIQTVARSLHAWCAIVTETLFLAALHYPIVVILA